jgi:hypothetical protein
MMFLNTAVIVKMNNLKRLYTRWFSNTVHPTTLVYFHLRSHRSLSVSLFHTQLTVSLTPPVSTSPNQNVGCAPGT